MTAAREESWNRVAAGYYRDADPAVAAEALAYGLEAGLFMKDETLLAMFLRMAELHPEVNARFREMFSPSLDEETRGIIHLLVAPPEQFRDARYLNKPIAGPADLDLLWGEFLVTGSLELVKRIIGVLDWKDLIRTLMDEALVNPEAAKIQLSEAHWQSFAELGILIGTTETVRHAHVAVPGDVDLLIWRGLQKKHEASMALVRQLGQEDILHLSTKGAALWSLRSNAEQHPSVKELCEAEADIPGGAGRRYLR
jgi:hypothetical protein